MPAARHRRALGDGMQFRGVNHYVLTYHIGGASARRSDPSAPGTALTGALSLQKPMSGGKFSSNGVVEYGHFYFKQSLVCEVADEIRQGFAAEPEDFFAQQDAVWGRDAEAYLFRACDQDNPPTSVEMDTRAYLIILGLLRSTSRRLDRSNDLVDIGRTDLRNVLELIEESMGEPLRLSELAKVAGMSPFHFARVFKKEIGEPPGQYLLRRRTEHAVTLIKTSTKSLSEIAHRTGFSSQSHMTRNVKALTGTTPGQIRAQR